MSSNIKKAVVIGETRLCCKCAEYLIDNKWEIILIVSDDKVVINWAKDHSILVLSTSQLNTIKASNFYLFSIINPCLIPKSFLTDRDISLTLNYHDSPLPKYAGVNSTTWAIINNEKTHGVTLHQITANIDDGDIVAQSIINIAKNETATSLNLKCSEKLLLLFQEVITKIEKDRLEFTKQDLANRTYYGLKYIPINYGIINGIKDVETLYRLVRGLTFGEEYDNPVATVKIRLKDNFYIAEDFNPDLLIENLPASKNTALFSKVRDIYGNDTNLTITYKEISTKYLLSDDDLQYLSNIKAQENKYKKQIVKFFKDYSEASLRVFAYALDKQSNRIYTKKIDISGNISTDTLLALTSFILIRFFRDNFIVSLYSSDEKIPPALRKLVDNRSFIYAYQELLNSSFTELEAYLTQSQKNSYTITKDFSYRYQLKTLTDIAITVGDVASTDKHRMVIKIKDGAIEIQGEISCQLQIDSIATAITTILSKNIQDELITKDLRYINILNQAQYQQIVYDWNKTEKDYPHNKTAHELFEEQVLKTPDNIAVVYEDKKLTYKELNHKANQLANYLLVSYKVKPDDLIVLCIGKSEQMIIAMLAILKSGGAYVPIEPDYPNQRISYVLNDTRTKVILTNVVHKDRLQQIVVQKKKKEGGVGLIAVDDKDIQNKLMKQKDSDPVISLKSTNLIYAIYTSGSTGNPKGVMIEHRGVVSLVKDIDYIKFSTNDTFIQFCSQGFDVATFEIWAPLLNGAKLVIPNGKKDLFGNTKLFYETLTKNRVTILWLTKTLFDQLFIADKKIFKNIKYLLVGGEALDKHLIEKLINSKYSPKNVINGYGPTENTSFSTTLNITRKNIANLNTVSIGRPFANRKAYILDKNLNVLPIGAVGELCVAGTGIARGYINRPDLTAEKFVDNPLQTSEEKLKHIDNKLYKTGDLARFLPNGNIEFLGRIDNQVKIRGFRIELGEIENSLISYPQIKQVAVVVKENKGHKLLLAYYAADHALNHTSLQRHLSSKLPDYMVPNIYVHLQHLPLTDSGKLNRKALPEPNFVALSEYIAPRNELEEKICKIYAQALNLPVEKVGITDDFFRMGGDSISSIQVVSQIRQQLNINLNISDIFNHRTIEQLVITVLSMRSNSLVVNKKIKREPKPQGFVDLFPIQKWFFENVKSGLFPKYNQYNQAFLIKTPELDLIILEMSIKKLLEQHDAFRLKYKGFKQYYSNSIETVDIKKVDISKFTTEEIKAKLIEIQSHFDIENGPVYTVAYLYGYKDKTARIFLAFHHLIVDSVSWRILTEDLANLYQLLTNKDNYNKDSQELLGLKGTSYKQWVKEIKCYKANRDEINYWSEILRDYTKVPNNGGKRFSARFSLSPQLTHDLLLKSNKAYHTRTNDLLLAAFTRTLAQIFNHQINYITFEGHGRETSNNKIDITKTLGWFTTMYPIRLVNHPGISELIIETKENLRNIPNKGIGYGPIKDYINLPNISFNYFGQIGNTKDLWAIVDYMLFSSPNNRDNNVLNVVGYVINNVFSFYIDCYNQQNIAQKIADQLRLNLEGIIKYCSNSRSYLTVSDIDKVIGQEYLDKIQKQTEVEEVYLANHLQQGMIYHAIRREQTDNAYLSQFVWHYKTVIDEGTFKQAWQLTQKRYPSLRLRFAWDNEIVQIIDHCQELDYRYIDLSHLSEKECQLQITDIIKKDRQEYYDLTQGKLIRVYLIKSTKNIYTCLCSIHHIILDGWSTSILVDAVHEIYSQLLNGYKLQIIEDITYKKVQKYLQEHSNNDKDYWEKQLKQIQDRIDLTPLLKPAAQGIKIKEHLQVEQEQKQCLEITGTKLLKLKETCQVHAVTINAVVQYAWHKLLSLYGNSDTTVVGTVVSGRNIVVDNIENAVGLFLNTLPLLVVHNNNSSLMEQVKTVQQSINEANNKSNINLANLQVSGERLFDSLLVYENMPTPKYTANIKYSEITEIFKVDYPLIIVVYEKNNKLTVILKYAEELFDKKTISLLLNRMRFFIEQIIDNPQKKNLNYLTKKEYQELVVDYNKTTKKHFASETIPQLFVKQVLKTPANIAVVYQNKKLSYEELNQRANQLAHYLLVNNKIKPHDLVALLLNRSEYTIITILAVLKAGATYVPIDPRYPKERIKYILDDTQAKIVIKESNINYKKQNIKVINIDTNETQRALLKQNVTNPETNITSTSLAYILYTSGTTGNPKGVMLEHASCTNRILEMINISNITEHDKILFKTNYVFDVSFSDIFTALLTGASLFVTKEYFDIEEICLNINKYAINICHFTPSQFKVFKETKGINIFKYFKVLHFSGEALNSSILEGLNKNIKCINYYGPTEAGEVTFDRCSKYIGFKSVIGCPISNTQLFILDKNLIPLPIGAIGELYLGGVCVARGYLNQPKLTLERFIDNPFQTIKNNTNNKLYKTGDLVRMLPDKNIEYIGRADFQVKIRGYRIELGEIENKLAGYPEIKQAVVVVSKNLNDQHLIAFYIANKKLNEEKIRYYLVKKLPDYMIPSVFFYIKRLPLTENGKLDRARLPEPNFAVKHKHVAPKNEQEKLICEAFAKVLAITDVGVNDDFFFLGGNSIQAIKLVSILQLNFDIKIADIFNLRTPKKLTLSSSFGKNFLQLKLEKVKLAYTKKQNSKEVAAKLRKLDDYIKPIENLQIDLSLQKPIKNVLLTGATGFLGCNVLNQLLEKTTYNIYLLIRANSLSHAFEKIKGEYEYYFDETLDKVIDTRVFILKADLEQNYLDLSPKEYQSLAMKIDSVIHTAALVKYYGEYNKSYSANVGATINLLEFTKLTRLKDFHYVSTIGVLLAAKSAKKGKIFGTEDDLPDTSEVLNHVYVRTKLLGERQVIKYRDYGLTCNIYRVGNLAFILKNNRTQRNIENNAFYNWIKCIFTIKYSTKAIDTIEITPADLTAEAMIKIFDKKSLSNQTYHIFNPYLFDITYALKNRHFTILPIDRFINRIMQYIKNDHYYDLIVKFLLHLGWLDIWEEKNMSAIQFLQYRTQRILKELDFKWPLITSSTIYSYLKYFEVKKDGNYGRT